MVLVTLASVVLNVCHARGGILPGIIAALPPLFLFAAFESLMRQLQQSVAPVRPAARPKAKRGPSEKRSAPPEAETENRKGRALELKATGMTNAAISRELGVSAATVSRYLSSKAA